MSEVEEVLTTEEATALLKVSTKTILGSASTGTLPAQKMVRAWCSIRSDLAADIRDGRGQSAALS